ncbi:MAG: cysteine-rich CWC family protein [Gammaproteobacteria bacterium]|nr:cysteine-rich CWC family protein [Gammaproteobacteria bacterium]
MKHESKQCPRCQAEFECKVGNIQLCQCSGVTLSDDEMAYLQEQYDDCLCARCLRSLQQLQQQGQASP